MALDFLTPLDLHGNELRGAAAPALGVLPAASGAKFQTVGVADILYWSDGTKWIRVDDVNTLLQHSLSELGAPTTDLSMATSGGVAKKITNVADATSATDVANLKIVREEIAKLVDSAPAALDTLKELSRALNDDPNFATTVATRIGNLETRVTNLENGTAGALARKYSASIGDGSATSLVVTHNLNSLDVVVHVYNASTKARVFTDVTHTSVNAVTIGFAQAPAANAYRVVVVG